MSNTVYRNTNTQSVDCFNHWINKRIPNWFCKCNLSTKRGFSYTPFKQQRPVLKCCLTKYVAPYAAPNSHKKDVNCSFLSSLQWMVRGVIGPTGQPVPNPATRDNRRELAVVPIPHQLMAGSSVPDKLKRHRTVTFSRAQVPYVDLGLDTTHTTHTRTTFVCHALSLRNSQFFMR